MMTSLKASLKNTNFTDLIEPMLREFFLSNYASAPGKGHAKSSHGVKKGKKIDFRIAQARKATEKANAPDPIQATIDREVKKLGGN